MREKKARYYLICVDPILAVYKVSVFQREKSWKNLLCSAGRDATAHYHLFSGRNELNTADLDITRMHMAQKPGKKKPKIWWIWSKKLFREYTELDKKSHIICVYFSVEGRKKCCFLINVLAWNTAKGSIECSTAASPNYEPSESSFVAKILSSIW